MNHARGGVSFMHFFGRSRIPVWSSRMRELRADDHDGAGTEKRCQRLQIKQQCVD